MHGVQRSNTKWSSLYTTSITDSKLYIAHRTDALTCLTYRRMLWIFLPYLPLWTTKICDNVSMTSIINSTNNRTGGMSRRRNISVSVSALRSWILTLGHSFRSTTTSGHVMYASLFVLETFVTRNRFHLLQSINGIQGMHCIRKNLSGRSSFGGQYASLPCSVNESL
jgi:hypothetical protein